MLIHRIEAGPLAANCYVVAAAEPDGRGAECVVVDPGQQAEEPVVDTLAQHGLTPVAVLLTHGHFDHVWSAAALCERYGIAAHIHPEDTALLSDPAKGLDPGLAAQLSALFGGAELTPPGRLRELADAQRLDLAGLEITVAHAPGHTPGSVAFAVAEGAGQQPAGGTATLFTGDLLFAGSIGRTDFPGGDPAAMLHSLAQVCLSRPDATAVHPGHGPATTIGRERVSNPFLLDIDTTATGPEPGRP